MALNKLRYDVPREATAEDGSAGCERSYSVRLTLDRGINASGVLHWQVPANVEAFTDLSETTMDIQLKVLKADGTALADDDRVFLNPGYLQCLFATCTVSLNGTPLPVNTHYAQTTTLLSYIGTTEETRLRLWGPLSGWTTHYQLNSTVADPTPDTYDAMVAKVAGSQTVEISGRLASDFLMSSAQFLPPGVRMDIRLTRQPDNFTLVNGAGGDYRIELQSASITIKRVVLRSSLRQLALGKFACLNGGSLVYNRLSTVMMPIGSDSQIFKWNNVYNSGQLPHTIYLVLVSQKAYYGDLTRLSNFFETGGVESMGFSVSGRTVMAEPFYCHYVYDGDGDASAVLDAVKSRAQKAYFALASRLGCVTNPAKTPGLSYNEFLQGCTIYVAQLGTCGGSRMEPGGALDVEVRFAKATPEPYLLMIFGEAEGSVTLDQRLNVVAQA